MLMSAVLFVHLEFVRNFWCSCLVVLVVLDEMSFSKSPYRAGTSVADGRRFHVILYDPVGLKHHIYLFK